MRIDCGPRRREGRAAARKDTTQRRLTAVRALSFHKSAERIRCSTTMPFDGDPVERRSSDS